MCSRSSTVFCLFFVFASAAHAQMAQCQCGHFECNSQANTSGYQIPEMLTPSSQLQSKPHLTSLGNPHHPPWYPYQGTLSTPPYLLPSSVSWFVPVLWCVWLWHLRLQVWFFFFKSVFPFQISLEAKGSFCSPVIYFWLFPYVSAFLTPLSQEQNWRTSLIFCGTTRTSKTASSASFDSLYLLEVLKTESVCDNLLNSWSVSHWVTSFSLAQQCTLIMEASGGHVPGWLTPLCPYESDWA